MAFSSTVAASDTALATQYNNLRKDVIDTSGGHTHNKSDSNAISLSAFTIATENVGVGTYSLGTLSTGDYNTAYGDYSGTGISSTSYNTAIGARSGAGMQGNYCIGVGYTAYGGNGASKLNTGSHNIAMGYFALQPNGTVDATGSYNIGIGGYNFNESTTAAQSIAIGYEALRYVTTGNENVAIGFNAYKNNRTGTGNTALGWDAIGNTSGTAATGNTALGYSSLQSSTFSGDYNVAVGFQSGSSITSGGKNICIGQLSGNTTTGNNNIEIGYIAQIPTATGSNQIRLGNTSVSYAGVQVAWTVTSDILWKENIKKIPLGLDFINELKPVEYNRKNDRNKKIEYGIIAQDLEKTLEKFEVKNAGILTKDDDDKLHLRYNDLIPVLIKAVQEQSKQIEDLKYQLEEVKNV